MPLTTMLSYDSPVPLNGSDPATSPTNITVNIATPGPKALRPLSTSANGASSPDVQDHADHRHIWLVTGPAGCGKSTVAKHLATNLNFPYIEGDEFHPKANIDKMASGIPLTDADRWDWLTVLREEALLRLQAGNNGVVVTCSALKRKYRDVIRVAPYFSKTIQVHFIYLHAPEEVLLKRVLARQNHYMGANMVHSQFDILEPPSHDEVDVISVDVSRSIDEVERDALVQVTRKMADKP